MISDFKYPGVFIILMISHVVFADIILIKDVPHILQKPDFCGEACIAAYLQKMGYPVTQEHVFNVSGVDPALGRGCVTRDMKTALENYGFKPGDVWYYVDSRNPEKGLKTQWNLIVESLKQEVPTIVCMRTSKDSTATEHFRLILGYDTESEEVIYHEPANDNGAYQRMKRDLFLTLLPLKYFPEKWLVIRLPLKVDKINIGVSQQDGFSNADFAQHIMTLRHRLPEGFTFVIQSPFIIIGDESPDMVKSRALHTVKAFSDAMKRQYFDTEPPCIFEIWLFKNEVSYRKYTKELFNDTPDTPFGYCSGTHSALIMNIATGGGTLCHEIVHAYVASNFPECPSWFNEGLGSLYEQCQFVDGKAMGMTNWRLAGLHRQIRNNTLPSFKSLCSTTTHEFYNPSTGDNYAQARYLLYYLQEHTMLETYYRTFLKNVSHDPTGYETLKYVLKEDDMTAFQKRWQEWVLALRFP